MNCVPGKTSSPATRPREVTAVNHPLSHLSNDALSNRLGILATRDRSTTVELLTHMSEFDHRKLYLPAGHSSMHAYCVDRLRMADDIAYKRIRTARAARRFPAILAAIASGSLSVSGVVLLAPYLKHATRVAGEELLATAENLRTREVERLLAERFPRPDVPASLVPMRPQLAARPIGTDPTPRLADPEPLAPVTGNASTTAELKTHASAPVIAPPAPARLKPLAPERYELHVTIDQATHDKLQRAQDLLGFRVAANDIAAALDRILDLAIAQLEKAKFAATDRPRLIRPRSTSDSRHVPADVRRAVWRRDGGRCTFAGDTGHRCEERRGLEFDHIEPFARGGRSEAANLRLRCRAHNQYEAERTFGAAFMSHKRERAPDCRVV